jgi:Fe-Mn family superoxide dismutase
MVMDPKEVTMRDQHVHHGPEPVSVQATPMSRRAALGALGVAGVSPFVASSAAMAQQTGALGWDQAAKRYTLPPLPYDYDALEPAIDSQTMRVHHTTHHAGYVKGLNKALSELATARESGDMALVKHWTLAASFNGSGHVNHTLFWYGMAPPGNGGGGEPEGHLAKTIERDFGSFAKFKDQFIAAASSVEGSGWGWLTYEPIASQLLILQAEKQQNEGIWGVDPLLGVDVWEHAYYLKYQANRGEYVENFFNVINWPEVSRRFDVARGAVSG